MSTGLAPVLLTPNPDFATLPLGLGFLNLSFLLKTTNKQAVKEMPIECLTFTRSYVHRGLLREI